MPNGNQDAAQDIFNAMMAAARGEDKVAGDLLRGAFGKISGQLLGPMAGAAAQSPTMPGAGPGVVEQGEKEPEVLGEE